MFITEYRTMRVSDILEMPSFEFDDSSSLPVKDILYVKRSDDFYPELVKSIEISGIHCPVLIIDGVFVNGHHRVAAAVDLGLYEIPYTDDNEEGWTEDWPDDKVPASWTWEELE